ncbi:MAG: malto-oligosyltrehalose synthase [Candidatus Velthaea sp.]
MVGALVDRVIQRPPTVPIATYRLQFTPQFGFRDAEAIVDYLRDLGIGHMYASPYLRARAGSLHGYDIVDHNALNPEVGTPEEHASMIAAAQRAGLGHILDFVPNHMGIGPDNPWWRDVLEWGELSQYATYFDIDWHPLKPELQGKVLVPTLGDHYGRVLENGELELIFTAERGEFAVRYFESRFPLALKSYADVLRRAAEHHAPALASLADAFLATRARPRDKQRRRALRERADDFKRALAQAAQDPESARAIAAALDEYRVVPNHRKIADRLDELLREQYYRLAFWRVAVDEINYRRFFDINDLAGLRVEDADVLAETHRLVFAMVADGRLQGLRIDHVDGLYNPGGYCNLLHERSAALGQPLYVVIEKILAPFERLRGSWLIAGTTGYEFANLVNGLFVDAQMETSFDRIYRRVIGADADYDEIVYEAKRRIMTINLASELTVLATELARIAGSDRRSSDYTYNGLREALAEVVAAFPVYRTYVLSEEVDAEDATFIDAAVALAAYRSALFDDSVFAFIADVLTIRTANGDSGYDRNAVVRFAMRFQQYTSPVMAKSVEDTAFYRYMRLVSLNEVGGDPRRFGTAPADFHAANVERASARPHTMLATSTHDHKRGEDVRTRIDALTEFPAEWSRALRRWSRLNRAKRTDVRGYVAPSANDEYLLYQTLLGTWPAHWRDPAAIDDGAYDEYAGRIVAYMQKAQREAKLRTSWANPDSDYEAASSDFVRRVLERGDEARFPGELAAFTALIAPAAMIASLAQTVMKCTAPGVPDIYQGCEVWDHSLVDPDNRRAVDYTLRRRMLDGVRADDESARSNWDDGSVKLYVTWRALQLRQAHRATFLDGGYEALFAHGPHAHRIVAFARGGIVTVVPRLVAALIDRTDAVPHVRFGAERVPLGAQPAARYRNVFTSETLEPDGDGTIAAADIFARFPVAVFEPA